MCRPLSIWRRELCRSHAGVLHARSERLQPLTWSSGHSPTKRRSQPKGVPNAHRPQRRAFPTHTDPNAGRSQRTPTPTLGVPNAQRSGSRLCVCLCTRPTTSRLSGRTTFSPSKVNDSNLSAGIWEETHCFQNTTLPSLLLSAPLPWMPAPGGARPRNAVAWSQATQKKRPPSRDVQQYPRASLPAPRGDDAASSVNLHKVQKDLPSPWEIHPRNRIER